MDVHDGRISAVSKFGSLARDHCAVGELKGREEPKEGESCDFGQGAVGV